MSKIYVDPVRLAGNQSEHPIFKKSLTKASFRGYQTYDIFKIKRAPGYKIVTQNPVHKHKYSIVRPYLYAQKDRLTSITDFGCSAGIMGLTAYSDGFKKIMFVDHDVEYLNLVSKALNFISADEPIIIKGKLNDLSHKTDVLFAFAVIHWLYSSTELFGSLDAVIQRFKSISSKTIFVEWIDPSDRAIAKLGHISHNPGIHQQPYDKKSFVTALQKHYKNIKMIGRISNTREIWIATELSCKLSLRQRIVRFLVYGSFLMSRQVKNLKTYFAGLLK